MERINQWLTPVANLAVFAGILFLAYEIEQNTDAVRSATYAAYADTLNTWGEFTAEHSEKLAVLQRQSSLDQIENGDQLVLFAYAAIVFNNAESVYLHHRAGSVDEDVFLARMGSFISYFDTVPIMKEVWNQGIGAETPEFVSYIESRVRGLNRPSESLTR